MTDETEANTKKQKAEDHDGWSDVSAGDIPAIEKFPNSLEKTLNDKQSIICQEQSPLYTNGNASRTAITSLTMT